MDDDIMKNYLEKFPGFCAKHLFKVMAMSNNPDHVKYLLKLHKERYKSLLADLKELCRKNDYRFRTEASGKEADSWQKAVHIVSGKI
jgi:REP element-mobilizing transposase RayT